MSTEIAIITGGELSTRTQMSALFAPIEQAAERFVRFLTANIRNQHIRRAYTNTVG